MMRLLQEEAELEEIVKLVGMDALSAQDRLKLEVARSIREDFLHQNAFHEEDAYTTIDKQYLMIKLILEFYDLSWQVLENGAQIEPLLSLPVRERVGRFKYISNLESKKEYDSIVRAMSEEIGSTLKREDF